MKLFQVKFREKRNKMKLFQVKFQAEGTLDVQAKNQQEAEEIAMAGLQSGIVPVIDDFGWQMIDETVVLEDDKKPDVWLKTDYFKK